eukprot:c8498_g1_i1.p1 GENE.c8498_g1_i1~~c8498_g1_i1.p1  ORF type:complete len:388 (+),score=153.49 c8498_g1_i1:25-1164(+)
MSSEGYANRLKKGAWRGDCGMLEIPESEEEVKKKAQELLTIWKQSKHVVVHTGAGISTSCGIPDFRGQNGIWTRESKGESPPEGIEFEKALPSFTHMALAALVKSNLVHYIVSQNVDGLHLRSGVPRDKLSELHGDLFIEKCEKCQCEYFRDYEITSVGFKLTGRKCEKCDGNLRDQCLDWDDKIPVYDLKNAEKHSKKANLSLCLGTSLQMEPSRNLPVMTTQKYGKKERGKLVICNLSSTGMDSYSNLNIRTKCDYLMTIICSEFGVKVEPFVKFTGERILSCCIIKNDMSLKRSREDGNKKRDGGSQKKLKKNNKSKEAITRRPILCEIVGCRFYGSHEMNFLCSKHFLLKKEVSFEIGSDELQKSESKSQQQSIK